MENPDWNQDELILVLDAYVKWNGRPPGKTSDEIAELSLLLNDLHRLLGTPPEKTLRNPNGVYMKLMNFRRLDPSFTAEGKSGLTRGNKLEKVVWNEFHSDPVRLTRIAASIRQAISHPVELGILNPAEDLIDDPEAVEGRLMTVMHKRRERSRDLVNKRKQDAIRKTGTLACEVCRFNFAVRYGDRGRDFIECHHTTPLEMLGDGTPTKLSDLALVCANCHRMIHSRRPWLTLEELRRCLQPL
jgi:5-methylcytosine-specific restriction protein A